MRDFFTVFKFELMGFLKKKAFIISTVIICLALIIGLSIPTIRDTFFASDEKGEGNSSEQQQEQSNNVYGYVNKNNSITNVEILKENFFIGQLNEVDSIETLEEKINSGEFEAGYIVEGPTEYKYVVKNNEMSDMSQMPFEEALKKTFRVSELNERGIEYSQVEDLIYPNVQSETKVLGKDSVSNYLYTYILVFGLYFMIILYGQLIATSVASEKSNRTMEVLVTSTKTRNLIFGKVLGGALAGVIQFGLILLTATVTYRLNAEAWNNKLDFVFDIPSEVILNFAAFGILGYLFYAFIYGALGALVSRTEDVSSSATPITLLFIGVFFVSMMGMQNTEGILLKIASFIPFSSFMSMFVRISMGSVSTLEIIISLGILLISTILVGIFAAMIYRMGTLMYGNRVKLKDAIKLLKN
ncbi:ABC transporter permease [Clostridium sp. D2Q-11]|uniref:ABC transporter permease n=1 Tax=Anaeromonas frigoriresistens TaxID=2683708 RepID=A0A942UVQ8_9FIRM|nr:ABC transporter permease [Anaeromonas frigoriresistens]MBS4538935.1 ABC transporter permease [Anaeromonas frigoriresistens]